MSASNLIKKIALWLGLIATLSIIAACANKEAPTGEERGKGGAQIQAEVFYLERLALPQNAKIHLSIQDVSLADAPAITLAEKTMITNGMQIPASFTLEYDPDRIKPNHRYSISARITVNDQLWFITTQFTQVMLDGSDHQPVKVLVERVTH